MKIKDSPLLPYCHSVLFMRVKAPVSSAPNLLVSHPRKTCLLPALLSDVRFVELEAVSCHEKACHDSMLHAALQAFSLPVEEVLADVLTVPPFCDMLR